VATGAIHKTSSFACTIANSVAHFIPLILLTFFPFFFLLLLVIPLSTMLPGRNSNAVLVSKSQHNNPVLKFVRNVPYEICDDLVCDYQLGASTCAIFLSLNFHKRYPEYIHGRIRELGRQYRLRLLLVLSDHADNQACLLELTKLAVIFDLTMLVCWSNAEVGRYLESFKILEHKSADSLQERKTDDYLRWRIKKL
jgi:DNA excision repair protein ERCC-1